MGAFFKKCGKNTSGLGNLVLMFVALVIISLGLLALRTFRAIPLARAGHQLDNRSISAISETCMIGHKLITEMIYQWETIYR